MAIIGLSFAEIAMLAIIASLVLSVYQRHERAKRQR